MPLSQKNSELIVMMIIPLKFALEREDERAVNVSIGINQPLI